MIQQGQGGQLAASGLIMFTGNQTLPSIHVTQAKDPDHSSHQDTNVQSVQPPSSRMELM